MMYLARDAVVAFSRSGQCHLMNYPEGAENSSFKVKVAKDYQVNPFSIVNVLYFIFTSLSLSLSLFNSF